MTKNNEIEAQRRVWQKIVDRAADLARLRGGPLGAFISEATEFVTAETRIEGARRRADEPEDNLAREYRLWRRVVDIAASAARTHGITVSEAIPAAAASVTAAAEAQEKVEEALEGAAGALTATQKALAANAEAVRAVAHKLGAPRRHIPIRNAAGDIVETIGLIDEQGNANEQ
jgi:hypothetical protein